MHPCAARTTDNGVYGESAERLQEADGAISAIDRNARALSALPKWRLKRVVDYVRMNIGERVTLADMAGAAGLSRMHFAAQFRRATGMRPHDYLLHCRIEAAQELLAGTQQRVIDVALAVGFQTQAHFTTVFKRLTGETPRRWRVAEVRRRKMLKPAQPLRALSSASARLGLVTALWKDHATAAQAGVVTGF
ncbi:helix-turn-helix domain-containing protein [Ancylobacter sp. IITR112]|uniref:helix-turn-helix domain-containing protein n=1 Tax=Ancylobacter sp. IITR112 TaxID=3138073 RepID=UPI00352A7D63